MSVTRRVFELRQAGYEITWTERWEKGQRIVTYTLEKGGHEIQAEAIKQSGTAENGTQAVQAEPGIEAPDAHPKRTEGMAQAAGLDLFGRVA